MKKNILTLALAVLLILVICSGIYAVDKFTIEEGILKSYNGYGGAVNIPNSVTSIGDNAFAECSRLTGITIPNSVTSIGDGAFENCSGLTGITIPNSVTSIGNGAFAMCSGLTGINIPNSVTSIGDAAFAFCSGLTGITIPNSVTSIRDGTFACCSGLTGITIPNSVTSIGSSAFTECSGLTGITIPNNITSIGSSAFAECSGLTGITIPNSVTSIGERAFAYCSGLTSINVDSLNQYYSSLDGVLYNKNKSALLAYPPGREGPFTIPDGVTVIKIFAFNGCVGLSDITIPDSVTVIEVGAFYGCTGLTSVVIPNSVTRIDSLAVDSCAGLTSVTIPSNVSFPIDLFGDCNRDLIIYGVAGSYAETFAAEQSIRFVAGDAPDASADTADSSAGKTGAPANMASEWVQPEIISAIGKGFVPEDIQDNYTEVITRQEFCRLAVRFTEYMLDGDIDAILAERGLSRDPNAFSDTSDPDILAAFAFGITYGTSAPSGATPGLFTPDGLFSRKEAATMLMRVCGVIRMDTGNSPASDFVDIDEADSWARDGINFVRANGIMGGTSATTPTFSPNGTYTRQESIATFNRIASAKGA